MIIIIFSDAEDTEQEQMECSVGENIENDEENIVSKHSISYSYDYLNLN